MPGILLLHVFSRRHSINTLNHTEHLTTKQCNIYVYNLKRFSSKLSTPR